MILYKLINDIVMRELAPSHMDLVNESHMHNVPANSETHFKLTLVDTSFEGLRPVQRHQKLYKLLEPAMLKGVHALALHLYTESEWRQKVSAPESPPCLGGEVKNSK